MEVIKMTKAELVDFIAEKADLTKADAGRALEAMMEGVTNGLKETGKYDDELFNRLVKYGKK